MELIIDGFIYQEQTYGGISRIFDNIIPQLCVLDEQLHIKLLPGKNLKSSEMVVTLRDERELNHAEW